jgi:hybrid cluster-associated redox disulfide protein
LRQRNDELRRTRHGVLTTMTTTMIDATSTVDDLVTAYPMVTRAFIARRMHCVGCELARFETIASAARHYGASVEVLLADIRELAGGAHA